MGEGWGARGTMRTRSEAAPLLKRTLARLGLSLAVVIALPVAAQDIIRKHSGDWTAKHFIEAYAISDKVVMEMLKSDPHRTIVIPSPRDRDIAHSAFTALIAEWEASSPRNHELLTLVKAELAKLHTAD